MNALIEIAKKRLEAKMMWEAIGMQNIVHLSLEEKAELDIKYDQAWSDYMQADREYHDALLRAKRAPAQQGQNLKNGDGENR